MMQSDDEHSNGCKCIFRFTGMSFTYHGIIFFFGLFSLTNMIAFGGIISIARSIIRPLLDHIQLMMWMLVTN